MGFLCAIFHFGANQCEEKANEAFMGSECTSKKAKKTTKTVINISVFEDTCLNLLRNRLTRKKFLQTEIKFIFIAMSCFKNKTNAYLVRIATAIAIFGSVEVGTSCVIRCCIEPLYAERCHSHAETYQCN